ncbi:MAG: hypothetical protein HOI25_11960 [Proteobacteria bacterium]|nr:hypothetical protein [Pseudomonadota bacterium]
MEGLSQKVTEYEDASVSDERNNEDRLKLAKARYMALDRYPVTDLANNLCQVVANHLIDTDRKRKNNRGKDALEKFHRATGAVIADLMLGLRREKSPLSYRTLSPATFNDGPVSYRNFKSIIDTLEGLGWVFKAAEGFYRRETISSGRATRYGINTLLLEKAANFEITPANVDKHFACELPRAPLVLNSAKEKYDWKHALSRYRPFSDKKRVHFEVTAETEKLEAEVTELNEFFSEFKLEGGTHRGYRRIFNLGIPEGYRWNKGGRLYSAGEENYQMLPAAERAQMRINGELVKELDIRASFLTILYAQRCQSLDLSTDPYEIEGIPRDVVKQWVVMTLGHDSYHRSWPKEFKDKFFADEGTELQKVHPIKKVRAAVLNRHPVIAKSQNHPTDIFDLMYLESEVMVRAMLQLKRVYGIPSLTVHDSILVRGRDVCAAAEVLSRSFRCVCGAEPEFGDWENPEKNNS